jgi:predicted metal-binding membrane protein
MRVNIDSRAFVLLMSALVAVAWVTLWLWGQSPYGRLLNHDTLSSEDFRHLGVLVLIVSGWTLMIIAMMLPTSLPLVALFYRLTRQRDDRTLLVVLLLIGYLSAWTLFGVIALLGDGLLHDALERTPWLNQHAWLIGVGILVLAGLYQFAPLKYACLEKCRTPLSFLTEHWRGSHERRHAFHLGIRHGLFCIGCCWSLMLLMFAVGAGNLGWMFLVGALMAFEKNVPWGRRLSAPLGVLLLCWGGLEAIVALS